MSAPSANVTLPGFNFTTPPADYFQLEPTWYGGQLAALILICLAASVHVIIGIVYCSIRWCGKSHTENGASKKKHGFHDIGHFPGSTLAAFLFVVAFLYGTTPHAHFADPVTGSNVAFGFLFVSAFAWTFAAMDYPAFANKVLRQHEHTHLMQPNVLDQMGRILVTVLAVAIQVFFRTSEQARAIATSVWVGAFFCACIGSYKTMAVLRTSRDVAKTEKSKGHHGLKEVSTFARSSQESPHASSVGGAFSKIMGSHATIFMGLLLAQCVLSTIYAYGSMTAVTLAGSSLGLAVAFTFIELPMRLIYISSDLSSN